MTNKRAIFIILLASAIIHFAFFAHPNQTVFDEVHFGKFVNGYYTNEYFFDIHPPLGKLIIAGFASFFDFEPAYSFGQIGQEYPDKAYMILRFLPSLAGTLLPIIIFLLARQLGLSTLAALGAGLFTTLDNALLVQSRYILLDAFLLDFGFLALYFFFRYRQLGGKRNLLAMAVFGALAASVKWTGFTFLALPFIIELYDRFKNKDFKNLRPKLIYFFAIPFLVYFFIFWIHFSLLSKPGPGDAFMTPEFRNQNIIQKFSELNLEMYRSNQRLTADHPYGSKWYTWPLMIRPIYYWVQNNARIYFLGNPFIWWASTVAMLLLIFDMIFKKDSRKELPLILLGGIVLNLLPFIGIKRVMFLYHYMTAYIFAILILAYLIDQAQRPNRKIYTLLAVAALFFIFFAPLSYGTALTPRAYENRVWLETWR